ncbi:low temperature viability protein domain-containing protein [Ditylenchus destructor]|uniref:Protein LTV1 homolog n=1 Tax=Ditylenchus destructor TaxID=166010 RepID=A0AAD4QZD2_9BILA|nr:low temperature viability protein domain-containing protein [Ditylenchus destructor]
MGKKKSFIDKKSATTFRLVHRSQKDPLIADDSVGQRVLLPVEEKTLEERHKYGIYYTDGYDYLQHLKDVGEAVDMGEVDRTVIRVPASSIQLPSTIFETQGVELKVGLLNQAAPDNSLFPDVDPEIAAALEGEFETNEDDFDDDFILKANAHGSDDEGSSMMKGIRITDTEEKEDIGLNDNEMDDKEERRSRFTNYSMSSAVIKRPNGLAIIDEQFEELYGQYDEDKLGADNGDEEELGEVAGFIEQDSERMMQLLEEHGSRITKFMPEKPNEEEKKAVLEAVTKQDDLEDDDEEMADEDEGNRKRRWDCESILSTYSNLQNHPKVIRETPTKKRKDTKQVLETMDDSEMDTETVISGISVSTVRHKGETPEERRLRKQAVKEDRRQRRAEKKSNQLAFKEKKKEVDRQIMRMLLLRTFRRVSSPPAFCVRNCSGNSEKKASSSKDSSSESDEEKPKIDPSENPTRLDPAGKANWRKAMRELNDKDFALSMQDPYKRQFEIEIRIGYTLLGAFLAVSAGISLCQYIREKYMRRMNRAQPPIRWEDFRREHLRKGRQVESIVFFPKYHVAEVYFRKNNEKVSPKDEASQPNFLEELLLSVFPTYFAEDVKPDVRFKYKNDKTSSEIKKEIEKFDAPGENGIYVVSDSIPSIGEMIFLAVIACITIVLVSSRFRRIPKRSKTK